MTIDERLKMEIGGLVVQNLMLQTTLAEAQEKLKALEPKVKPKVK